ncbi:MULTISPECIES: S41 family peptidase [Bacillaceae]|uniref:Tail specific protease domain-containing protein n=1 Tax=Evansella alkalicola TaxID=745819 RepID=A0ABS6JWL5_9BACI|nr:MULTISPECIES: S41 family peptidase [Bacillaceae]MBU9722883.1 hypothetical protein [Bacillus alkalicola]
MKKVILVFFTTIFFIIGCSEQTEGPVGDPLETYELLTRIVEDNRSYTEHDFDGVTDLLYDYTYSDDELPEEILQSLRFSMESKFQFSKEDMIEDVELMNSTLKYKYALYEFMGGDEAFAEAKYAIIEEINQMPDDLVNRSEFIQLLLKHYDFIEDTHFHIDQYPIEEGRHGIFLSEKYQFVPDGEGNFYLLNEDGSYTSKLSAVNGDKDVETYLKPTINEEGAIVYVPGIFTDEEEEFGWQLKMQGEKETEEVVTVTLEEVPYRPQGGSLFEMKEQEGIPYLTWRTMMVRRSDPFDYFDMIDTAEVLKDEPYFILDLRSNGGGNTLVVDQWLEKLFDDPVSLSSKLIRLFSNTGYTFVQDTVDLYDSYGYVFETFDETEDFYLFDQFDYPMDPQWELEYSPLATVEDNETHIFILIDRGTASAGEYITALLKNVNNTTVIGVNSAGAVRSGNTLLMELPNTTVDLSVPVVFMYEPDLVHKEAIGIEPDLWVDPEKVEERVIKLIHSEKRHLEELIGNVE